MQHRLFALFIVFSTLCASSGSTQAAPAGTPQLGQPPNGAQLSSIGTTLTWSNPVGATQYYLEVIPSASPEGGAPDGPAITLVRNVESAFTIQPPKMGEGNYVMLPDMTYTWRIRASDSQTFAPPGDASYGPSAQRTFRTAVVASNGIAAVQPSEGATVSSVTPMLQWTNNNDAVFYYEIQLSRDAIFDTGIVHGNFPVYWELVHGGVSNPLNSYQVRSEFPLDAGATYYWRVRPRVQGDGRPVQWSTTFSFTTPGGRPDIERVFPNVTPQSLTNMVQPDDGTGRFFITEQPGVIRVFQPGSGATVFLDIRNRVLTANNEEGLLGLAFDPDFRSNGHFYVYYSKSNPLRNVVSRFTVSGDPNGADAGSEVTLLESPKPFGNHNGGQLMFGPDGYLYIGIGDGGSGGDPQRNGQNVGTILGKILRIDVRSNPGTYQIPPDNPFAGNPNARGEVWAYGLRNPWRFSFDRETGELWVGDVGQNEWEEVSRVEKGKNYGWNVMEGFHCYSPSSGCNQGGLELPMAEYANGGGDCSVTGGYVYRGNQVSSLRGAYLYADFCSGKIWSLRQQSDGVAVQQILDTNLQITSFAQDAQGELYVLARSSGIYRIIQR